MTVRTNLRSVTGISGNSHGLTGNRGLGRHVVGRGSVEVVVGPVEEFLLTKTCLSTAISDSEFSSLLEKAH